MRLMRAALPTQPELGPAGMGGDPWKVLVAAALWIGAGKQDGARAIQGVLAEWPHPAALAAAPQALLANVVRQAGLRNAERRARSLRALSAAWLEEWWATILDLPGCSRSMALLAITHCGKEDK